MVLGFLIIIIFPFIFFYTQASKLGQKTSAIKQAMDEGKETYIDPLTGKLHWTENGEQVIWTEILSVEKNIPNGCIVGDRVLRGAKSNRVYKNTGFEKFEKHVQDQIDHGEIWCYERADYAKKYDDYSKQYLRYHMKEKYFYTLQKSEKKHIAEKSPEEIEERRPWDKYVFVRIRISLILRPFPVQNGAFLMFTDATDRKRSAPHVMIIIAGGK